MALLARRKPHEAPREAMPTGVHVLKVIRIEDSGLWSQFVEFQDCRLVTRGMWRVLTASACAALLACRPNLKSAERVAWEQEQRPPTKLKEGKGEGAPHAARRRA